MSEPITNVADAVAELGALPMPAGPELQPLKVFVALYDGAEPEVFTTAAAARDCCDDLVKVDVYDDRGWDWVVNEDGVHVQFWTHVDDDRPLSETSGTVTPVVVQGLLSELDRLQSQAVDAMSDAELLRKQCDTLRDRVAELEAERHTTNEALDDAVQALRVDGITQRIVPVQALREDEPAEATELTVFRASHDSIVMGLYTTAAEARKHCETLIGRDWPNCNVDWVEDDEDGVAELTVWVGGEERTTGYVVTALEIASAYDEKADE